MGKLIILDYATGDVDIYPEEYSQEPNMTDLLDELGHKESDCNWMFFDGEITFHKEVLKDETN